MITVDRDLILKLEQLSRLELSDAERERAIADLRNMIALVDQLGQLDLSNVPPLAYLNDAVQTPRADVAQQFENLEAALQNAPVRNGPYLTVPKVPGKSN